MPDALMLAAALLAAGTGMGWLALAMDVHWEQACGDAPHSPARAQGLRIAGALSLGVSLGLCLAVDHPSMAALVWVMILAAATLVVAFTLTWRPRWLAVLAWGADGKP